ncbi:ubiquinol-cytochrome c reductase complex assembly factor 4 isoform X2 [Echeneis naucrates]|uniref:ubiquinol-cytochrome c reductase complex assembly factor 4 isoform X2 n=1 Tax=Echeneis naucrates TaxID=173247 RepID=UPI001113924F|nr:protein CCSMST1 isoform X2 [Echeneis naucrates]
MSTAGRVFIGLTRVSFSRAVLNLKLTRPSSVRSLALSSQRPADEENNEPIKFSTSKASHRTWKVHRSMGSQFEQPWWKVLTVSLIATSFLLWCILREDVTIDSQMEKQLYEHLPNLHPPEEHDQKKSS